MSLHQCPPSSEYHHLCTDIVYDLRRLEYVVIYHHAEAFKELFKEKGSLTTEIIATKNVTLTMCGAEVRDQTSTPLLVGVIGGAVAILVFGMRICSRLPSGSRILGWDDWTIAFTVLLAAPPTVFSVLRTCTPAPILYSSP